MGRLTTHVLDTAAGRPAAGVRIELFAVSGDSLRPLTEARTNADGRCDQPLLEGAAFTAGVYELRFHVGDYFGASVEPKFLDVVPLRFGVADASQHWHAPLLISPYAYSTYRGS